ncbi:SDR family NAD(P)-dependent oxidoreductase [Budviciaceae bacterium BWR-B9]|uniref:SDR family NAD(P)-dependent oxidoreductase n=1 Tax=Limnobaculum allomyrinae TaxID=2791986 RepID=A0ABS1IM52_9GAMM|nr:MULTISPECIES: SDR family NAD(P)-dependent oxidoreductase [Limnobaculum]MBK5142621.1 SDR family NAD(P)-dependent oxidoreductase [Limnobaculum allomyrinae]MBV7690493.1 SDR family NAD(P)-dependent oxidoreductase [Limnobaculum sp. M2-1]
MMTRKPEGKEILITGETFGIGEAIAKIYVKEGCKVALHDIDEPCLKRVAGGMFNQGFDVISLVVNIRSYCMFIKQTSVNNSYDVYLCSLSR